MTDVATKGIKGKSVLVYGQDGTNKRYYVVCTDNQGRLVLSPTGAVGAGVATLLARCTEARLSELDPANMPADLDTLLARLTAARAGYLDELAAANLPADVDTLLARLTTTRATYLDYLFSIYFGLVSVVAQAQAGAPATITLAATSSAVHDFYNGMICVLYTGAGAGQARAIVDYDGGTKIATVSPAWATQPDGTSWYVITTFGSAVLSPPAVRTPIGNYGIDLATAAENAAGFRSIYTDARGGYLDELAAANLPADIDTLLARLTALRAGYLDNLSAGAVALASVCTAGRLGELDAANIPADIDTLLARLTAVRAGYLDELAAANIPADIDGLKTSRDRTLCGPLEFWSLPVEELSVTAAAGTKAGPDITVADIPAGATVVRAHFIFKPRMIENTNAAANSLDGATVAATSQVWQIRDDTPGAWVDCLNYVDDQHSIEAETREGGDAMIGHIDVASTVDGNDTYNTQWLLAKANQNNLNYNDYQVGIRLWYSI